MKYSMESLDKKLLAYTISAGATLLISQQVNAAIQYSGLQNIEVNSGAPTVLINLNGVGDDNFLFQFMTNGGGATNILDINSNGTVSYESWLTLGNYIRRLPIGYVLSAGMPFTPANNQIVKAYTAGEVFGSFADQTGYIGVKIVVGGADRLGWIQYRATADGTQGTIVDWAYEDSGGNIRAGNSGVPEIDVQGLPALRLEGPYLAIATLGFGLTVTQILGRLHFLGGHMGLQSPPLNIFGLEIGSDMGRYAVIVPICVFLTWTMRNLTKTRVGRALIAIRDSDIAAECIGVNLTWYKTLAFAISAFYTGIAGGLMAFVLGFINPHSFNVMVSVIFLAMVVVGGLGSVLGSVMGAILFTFLQIELSKITEIPFVGSGLEFLSNHFFTLSGLPNVQYVVFGLIMVLIIIFEPLGLYGIWIRTKIYWRTWPF